MVGSSAWPGAPRCRCDRVRGLNRVGNDLPRLAEAIDHRRKSLEDYGEVIVCADKDEMVREADRIASEHVQVMTRDPDFFLAHDELRLAVPRLAHECRLRRQGDRHELYAAPHRIHYAVELGQQSVAGLALIAPAPARHSQ